MSQSVSDLAVHAAAERIDARGFLERLRTRLLRATAGMRPGMQRLELAIEVFWYAALDVHAGTPTPWRALVRQGHPLRALLNPVRMMIRSELIHAGVRLDDAALDDILGRMLDVAQREAQSGCRDEELREAFLTALRQRLRSRPRPVDTAMA